ncbi:MAG: hypothetical protein AAGA30_12275 [Planctomycetota bacterium]
MRFRIKSILILVAFVALCFAFVRPWILRSQQQRQAIEIIESCGGRVAYAYQYQSSAPHLIKNPPEDPNWLCRLLGSEYFRSPVYLVVNAGNVEAANALGAFTFEKHPPQRFPRPESLDALNLMAVRIKHLDLRYSWIDDLSFLKGARALEVLNAPNQGITEFNPLVGIDSLRVLDLSSNPIASCDLSEMVNLDELRLSRTSIRELKGIERCQKLKLLDVSRTGVSDISGLSGKSSLRYLNIGNTEVEDLTPLTGLDLNSLLINGTKVTKIEALSAFGNLELFEAGSTGIGDLSPLKNSIGLKRIGVGNTSVRDLTPLKNMTGLEEIFLHSTAVVDVSVLLNLPSLKRCSVPDVVRNQHGDLLPLAR